MRHSHPIFAAIHDRMVDSEERAFRAALRSRLLSAAKGMVVEIGAGTGLNFPCYQPSSVREVVGVEPDPHMRRRAEPRAATAAVPIRIADGTAEALPVASKSADTIVSTLVLCSVDDPEGVIREWRRVLNPEGQVLLIEHIRSDDPWRSRLQDFITPLWRRLMANCHPNRPTLRAIESLGFEFRENERGAGRAPWIAPMVSGVAVLR
jgi:ubiquinone/menaquinone biosynthesis C-methylase UbiE